MAKLLLSYAITALIGFLGFISMDGTFGEQLINAFEWLNVMHYIGLAFISVLAIVITLGLGASFGQDYGKTGAGVGVGVGLLVSIFILAFSVAKVYFSGSIAESIDPSITSFSDITDRTYFYIYGLIITIAALMGNSTNKSSD
jgi:hypothetical protein